jgi:hypothetical protein
MSPAIDNPASYEIRDFIHFLHCKNMSASQIYPEFCAESSKNVMREGTIRQ